MLLMGTDISGNANVLAWFNRLQEHETFKKHFDKLKGIVEAMGSQ